MNESQTHFDVIVIGGGASGMMAAGTAAHNGKRVLLLEKNAHLGEKLKITGGGRCNITNAEYDTHALLKNYGKAAPFLYSPFSQFGIKDTFAFFESHKLPLVVQARKRAFPITEKAPDVVKVFEKYLKDGEVSVKTNARITKILTEGNSIVGVVAKGTTYKAKSYILATGGMSHPETGSTGDGFGWLKDLGHTIWEPTPTIVPLAVSDKWIKSLSGTSLSFMKITFSVDGVKKFSKTGKLLFTHFGLSGPLILNSAAKVADLLHIGQVTATIDAYPDTDHASLDEKILNIFEENKNRMLKNIFDKIAPHGTAFAILSLITDIPNDTKVHSITKDARKRIVGLLKSLPVTITGLMGFDRAVVADGGIQLEEIDMKTMRSKKIQNLHVTGDLLNINRPSGGYSLQLCWTTGYIAGKSV